LTRGKKVHHDYIKNKTLAKRTLTKGAKTLRRIGKGGKGMWQVTGTYKGWGGEQTVTQKKR